MAGPTLPLATQPNESAAEEQDAPSQTPEEIAISNSTPVPVAAFLKYRAEESQDLRLTRDQLSRHWTVNREDGAILFLAESGHCSSPYRAALMTKRGRQLFQIKMADTTYTDVYYAETSKGGPRVFELSMHTRNHVAQVPTNFHNVAEEGR
jgi:hypothetical protein